MTHPAQNLTTFESFGYATPVPAKSGAGISLLNTPSATALNRSVFFVPPVYGSAFRRTFGFVVPRSDKANPLRTATLLISLNRGSYQISEGNAMNDLSIGTTSIRQIDGLYNLNDLHKAAGREKKHQPALFLRLANTKELIEEITNSTDVYISDDPAAQPVKKSAGNNGGTYACKELIYAYAMWISPKFSLHVIRAFDALQHPAAEANTLPAPSTALALDTSNVDDVTQQTVIAMISALQKGGCTSTITIQLRPDQEAVVRAFDGKVCVFNNQDVIDYADLTNEMIGLDVRHLKAQTKFLKSSSVIEQTEH